MSSPGFSGPGASPWRAEDAVRLVAVIALGMALCGLASVVASGRAAVGQQLPLVCLAVAGLVVIFYGQTAWLLRGRRAVGERARHLLGEGPTGRAGPGMAVRSSNDLLVAGQDLTRFHRAGCPLARGQGWAPAPRATHEASGKTACGVCRP